MFGAPIVGADIPCTESFIESFLRENQRLSIPGSRFCHKLLKGVATVKLYKNIKISEASVAPENRFLMCCTVSGVHLTDGMLLRDNIWNGLHEARPG